MAVNGRCRTEHFCRDSSVLQQAIRRLCESNCKWLLVVNEVFDIAVNNFDAKKSARYSWVLIVTKLVVAGILLVVQCSYQGIILSYLMSTNH